MTQRWFDKIRDKLVTSVQWFLGAGVTDAESMVKKFQPVLMGWRFAAKLSNQLPQLMINNVPSAPFSMNWYHRWTENFPGCGMRWQCLSLSRNMAGRAVVEKEIFERLGRGNSYHKPLPPGSHCTMRNKSFLMNTKQADRQQPVPTIKASGSILRRQWRYQR